MPNSFNRCVPTFQAYLKLVLAAAQCVTNGTGTAAHARVAMRCLTGLLKAAPHFNYSSDILQAVVPRMVSPDAELRGLCCGSIRELLAAADAVGSSAVLKAALDAVQLVADLVKRRKCVVAPEVVRCLAVLQFREVRRPGADDEEEGKGEQIEGACACEVDLSHGRMADDYNTLHMADDCTHMP